MTTTNPNAIDTGFAPWSMMTPDAGVSKRGEQKAVQEARVYDRDDRSYRAKPDDGYMFGDDGVSFGDFLDMVNPLHHLPVVGPIYRALTGDEIEPGARIAGSALYGGPVGLMSGALNAMIEETTGDDIGGQALALLFGGDETDSAVAAGDESAVEVADLPANSDINPPLDLAALSGFTTGAANTGGIEPARMPAARYGGAADGGNDPDIAAAMFAANGNSIAAANVAAFNQSAFRRSDLANAEPQTTQKAGGATRISQRLSDHLAKLAGQTLQQPMPEDVAAAPAAPAPRTISGPLPEAFSNNAPEGNPFAAAADPAPLAMQTASLSGLTLANDPLAASEMQAAITQSGSTAVGYENPNDIARAMKMAIERYEQQRAAQQG